MKQTVFKKLRLIGTHISLPLLLLCMSAQNVSAQITKVWNIKDKYPAGQITSDAIPDPYVCKDDAGHTILTVNFLQGTWETTTGENLKLATYNGTDLYMRCDQHPKNGDGSISNNLLPNYGAAYSFTPEADGAIIIDGVFKTKDSRYLWVVEADGTTSTAGTSIVSKTGSNCNYNGKNVSVGTKYAAFFIDNGTGNYLPCKLSFPVQGGKTYFVFSKDAEGLVFKSFSYTAATSYNVDDNTSAPYLHQKVSIPGCTMMFGGWLTAADDKTAATSPQTSCGFTKADGNIFTDEWKVAFTWFNGTKYNYIKGTGNPAYRESIGAVGPGTGYDGSAPSQFDDVPCYGTYYKFNPNCDGTLQLQLYNDGDNNNSVPTKWCYFIDETGTPQYPTNDAHVKDVNGSFDVKSGVNSSQDAYFDVKAGKTYYLFCDAYAIGFRSFKFVYADASSANYVTLNQTDSYSQAATNNANIELNRTYLSGWNTICLPFSMSQDMVRTVFGSDVALETFNVTVPKDNTTEGKTQRIVYFRKHYYQDIVAGVPYLIYLPTGASLGAVNIPYATIEGVAAKTIYDKASYFNYVGTYSPLYIPSNDYYLASSASSIFFSRSSTNNKNYMKGFRAYFQSQNGEGGVSDVQNAKAASFGLDDEETTGIIEIENSVTTESKASAVYNINGSKVAESLENANLPKGVYIVNGKKVVLN